MGRGPLESRCHCCEQYSHLVEPSKSWFDVHIIALRVQQGWQLRQCSKCGIADLYAVNAQMRFFWKSKFDQFWEKQKRNFEFQEYQIDKDFNSIDKMEFKAITW
jgi:hypothetical protein